MEHTKVPFGSDFRTVVDVGASRGQFALFAAERFPHARLLCYEPLPSAAERLKQLMGPNVEVRRSAVGTVPGSATLHVANADDSSSLLPISARQVTAFPGTHERAQIEVPVEPLSEALDPGMPRPCLLKVDVQGAELDVLRSAGASLQYVDEILVECSFVELYEGQALADDVVAYLKDNGFRLRGVFGVASDGTGAALQADFLFHRPS